MEGREGGKEGRKEERAGRKERREYMAGVLGRWKCVSKEALLLHNTHESRKFKGRRNKLLSNTSNTKSM
jgi:hypothetical protein